MPYTFSSKVRYSECDSEGRLTPFSVINYLQDCSTFQSEGLGVGLEYLRHRNRAWFLSSWSIIFDRYPRLSEDIEIGTFAHGFRSFYGYRHFYIKGADGRPAVRADSIWFFYDTEHKCPQRPLPEDVEAYEEEGWQQLSEAMDMPRMERKIRSAEGMKPTGSIEVTRHFLDSNQHVNNAWYVDMAVNAAGINRPRALKAEYRKAAVLGDIIYPYTGLSDGKHIVDLREKDGTSFALVEFMTEG